MYAENISHVSGNSFWFGLYLQYVTVCRHSGGRRQNDRSYTDYDLGGYADTPVSVCAQSSRGMAPGLSFLEEAIAPKGDKTLMF